MPPKHSRRRIFSQQQFKSGFMNLFGAHSFAAISVVVVTIITLDWFGEGLLALFTSELKTNQTWFKLIPFLVIFLFWWLIIKNTFSEIGFLKIREYDNVPESKVLIKFLSLYGQDKQFIREYINNPANSKDGLLKTISFREQFQSGWRMSLEAIAHHSKNNVLEKIIVIPSADAVRAGKLQKGSHEIFPEFKRLIENSLHNNVSINSAGEIAVKWKNGVDYESAKKINDCLQDVYSWLHEHNYDDVDIIIDITSGQKLGSGIACVFSLNAGRQFQYVSTHDYSVKSYDIIYEAE